MADLLPFFPVSHHLRHWHCDCQCRSQTVTSAAGRRVHRHADPAVPIGSVTGNHTRHVSERGLDPPARPGGCDGEFPIEERGVAEGRPGERARSDRHRGAGQSGRRPGLPGTHCRRGEGRERRAAARRRDHGHEPRPDPTANDHHGRRRHVSSDCAAAGGLRNRVRALRVPHAAARGRAGRHQHRADAERRPRSGDAAGDGHGQRRLAGRRHHVDHGRHQLHEGAAHGDSQRP